MITSSSQKLEYRPFLTVAGEKLLFNSLSVEDRKKLSTPDGLRELDRIFLNGEGGRNTGATWSDSESD